MAYLGAMSRQRDPSIDPNLAEAYSARQERLNKQALDLLAEEGAIGARGAERMGDIAAQGIKEIVPAYQAGRRFRNENESHLIRVENSRAQQARDAAEDAYWNQEMPEDYSVSVPPSQVKPHTVIGGVDFGPQRAPIAPSKPGFSMTDPQFLPQSKSVSSPGAAAVLDGTAPQYGGAVPAPVSAKAPAPGPQGNGPVAPPVQGAPQGMPNTSPIPDRTEYLGPMGPAAQPYQMRKMTGGVDFGQAEDAGPPSDFNMAAPPWENQRPKPLTRRQHMLQLQEQKAEEEVKLLREGKGKGTQAVEWQDTGRVTGEGYPIMFNRVTGQYKAQPDIMTTAKGGKTGAAGMTPYQEATLDLAKQRLEIQKKKGPSAAGVTPYQQFEMDRANKLDEQRRGDKLDAKQDKDIQKYSSELDKTGVPSAIVQLEKIHGIMDRQEDIPGYGATGMLPDPIVSRDAQDLRQSAATLFNLELRDRSGTAVTDNELQRLKNEFGQGNWKTDRQLREGIRQYETRLKEVIRNINAGVDPTVLRDYKARGGRDIGAFDVGPEYQWDKNGKRWKRGTNPKTGEQGWVPAP